MKTKKNYDEVKEKDDEWASIENNEYIRVTFEEDLTKENDITIYARAIGSESSSIEIYTKDGNQLVNKFENILDEDWYKVYLTNLDDKTNIFDLKVLGEIEFDYIVDPTENPPSQVWNVTNSSGMADVAYAIAIDSLYVYITGYFAFDFETIKNE